MAVTVEAIVVCIPEKKRSFTFKQQGFQSNLIISDELPNGGNKVRVQLKRTFSLRRRLLAGRVPPK
ncbi:hypothetical protein RUM43_000479, partial [Polyplax serrata]